MGKTIDFTKTNALTGIKENLASVVALMPRAWQREVSRNIAHGECQEIRLRLGRPVQFLAGYGWVAAADGVVSREDIDYIVERVCQGSLYAHEEGLRLGYLTVRGGHRIGFTGQTVLNHGKVQRVQHFNSLNIRLAREKQGIADRLFPYLWNESELLPYHTLLISPPRSGKTTFLRDITRYLSRNPFSDRIMPLQVAVVDERSEIAGCYRGVPQLDVGPCTDVLDGCPKAEGIMMLMRSMSPDIIVTDEIGRHEDVDSIAEALNGGVKLITTAHGTDVKGLGQRPVMKTLIQGKVFERYVVLSSRLGPGTVEYISDHNDRLIWQGGQKR